VNWDAIGAVAEIISAAGVVISLVYLALQIRGNSSATRHASVDRLVEMWSSHIGAFTESPHLAALWVRGLNGIESLSREEQAILFAFIARVLRVSEAIHIHHTDRTIDAGLWAGIDASLTDILATAALRRYWEIRNHWFGPEFRKYVSGRIQSRPEIDFYPVDHSS
jgi:hypothetical protein